MSIGPTLAVMRRASSRIFLFWRDVQSVNLLRRVSGAPRRIHFNGRLLAIPFGSVKSKHGLT